MLLVNCELLSPPLALCGCYFGSGLLKKSKENKAKNDQDRLDRFYNKEFAINKLLGAEVLPDACDPRVGRWATLPLHGCRGLAFLLPAIL
jgi:hypothetical protein